MQPLALLTAARLVGTLCMADSMTLFREDGAIRMRLANASAIGEARCEQPAGDDLRCVGTFLGPDGESPLFTLTLEPQRDALARSTP